MAGPLQKPREESEAEQIKQFAGLVRNFNVAQFEFNAQFAKMSDNPYSAGIPNPFIKAKADFNSSFQKLSDFAIKNVSLLTNMMKQTGEFDDMKEIKLLQSVANICDRSGSYTLSYASSFTTRDVPRITLWAKTKTDNVPLFYFYDAGREGSEKNAGIVVYPSEALYKEAELPLGSVPKKVR